MDLTYVVGFTPAPKDGILSSKKDRLFSRSVLNLE